ncbi:MAG TPA: virulence factor [Alphaproteobacteria bacterium]|nr:virulence factor [Alphaproteobacteria bacterium]
MPQLTILFWRDIPSQVVASAGRRNQAKAMLSQRFQDAIDRAAMRGKARDADSYLDEWRRAEPVECGDDLAAEAAAAAGRLEAEYDEARLRKLVEAGGVEQ